MNLDDITVGCKVRCDFVDYPVDSLEQNKVYTVAEISETHATIRLKELQYWYKPFRFSRVVAAEKQQR